MSVVRIIVISLLAVAVLYVAWMFNRLIALKVRAANAWSDIDVQLKRRWDLVPSLVQTVRGYAAHEAGTLERTVAARAAAQQSKTTAERGRAESQVAEQVRQIFVLAEAYPDLKADELFGKLQRDLIDIEDHLQSARRYYNAVVRDLNTLMQQFPQSLVAGLLRFQPREFFQLDDAAEAAAPVVDWKER